jgi:acetyl esterase/lipase
MTSRSRVDPALLPLLEIMGGEWSAETLASQRALAEQMRHMASAVDLPAGISIEERMIDGPVGAPALQVLLIFPPAQAGPRPAILHMHGGGYVVGSAQMYRAHLAKLSLHLGAMIVSVNYRLAPETIFPGAIEDCYAALKWLSAEAGTLNVNASRIAVAGESAGGGLAAALAILARDRGEVALIAQILTYPMLDDRTGATIDAGAGVGEFIWTPAANRFGWASLLGHTSGEEDVSPYAAAARCDGLSGLPAAFIAVGDLDLFLEEDLEYARRLARASVPIALKVYPGAVHAFNLVEQSASAQQYEVDLRAAYQRAFALPR